MPERFIDKTEERLGEIVPEEMLGELGDEIFAALIAELSAKLEVLEKVIEEILKSDIPEKLKENLKGGVQELKGELKHLLETLESIRRTGAKKYTPVGDFLETVAKVAEYKIQLSNLLWELFKYTSRWLNTFRDIMENVYLAHELVKASRESKSRYIRKLYKISALRILGYGKKLPRRLRRVKIKSIREYLTELIDTTRNIIFLLNLYPQILEEMKEEIEEYKEESKEICEIMKEINNLVKIKKFQKIKKFFSSFMRRIGRKIRERSLEEERKKEYEELLKVYNEKLNEVRESLESIRKFFDYLAKISKDFSGLVKSISKDMKIIKKVIKNRRFKRLYKGRVWKKILRLRRLRKIALTKSDEKFLKFYQKYSSYLIKDFLRKKGVLILIIRALLSLYRRQRIISKIDRDIEKILGKNISDLDKFIMGKGFRKYIRLLKKKLRLEIAEIKTEIERLRKLVEARMISKKLEEALEGIKGEMFEIREEEQEFMEAIREELKIMDEVLKGIEKMIEESDRIVREIERKSEEVERELIVKLQKEAMKRKESVPEKVREKVEELTGGLKKIVEEIISKVSDICYSLEEIKENVRKRNLSKEFWDILKEVEKGAKKDIKDIFRSAVEENLRDSEKAFENSINYEIKKAKIEIRMKKWEIRNLRAKIYAYKAGEKSLSVMSKIFSGISHGFKLLGKIPKIGKLFNRVGRGFEKISKKMKGYSEKIKKKIDKLINDLEKKIAELKKILSTTGKRLRQLRMVKRRGKKLYSTVKKDLDKEIKELSKDVIEILTMKGSRKVIKSILERIEKSVEPLIIDVFDEETLAEAEALKEEMKYVEAIIVLFNDLCEDSLKLLERLNKIHELKNPEGSVRRLVEMMDKFLDYAKLHWDVKGGHVEILDRKIDEEMEKISRDVINRISRMIRRIRDIEVSEEFMTYFGELEVISERIVGNIKEVFRKTVMEVSKTVLDVMTNLYYLLAKLKEFKDVIERNRDKISYVKTITNSKIKERFGKLYRLKKSIRRKWKGFKRRLMVAKIKIKGVFGKFPFR